MVNYDVIKLMIYYYRLIPLYIDVVYNKLYQIWRWSNKTTTTMVTTITMTTTIAMATTTTMATLTTVTMNTMKIEGDCCDLLTYWKRGE